MYQHMKESVLPTCRKQQDKDPPRATTDMNWSFTWSASDNRPENIISNSISISSRDAWRKKNIKELLEGEKQDPHVMGGLIFAAKCGENCLTLLVTFSLKVTAKLQSQIWAIVNNSCPDENYHFCQRIRTFWEYGQASSSFWHMMYNDNKETIILQKYALIVSNKLKMLPFNFLFNSKIERDYRFLCSNYCLENVNLMFPFGHNTKPHMGIER